MTRSLQRCLAFIKRFIRDNGAPPSLGDIGREFRCSRSRAHQLVVGLERAGEITRTKGQALSIRLIDPMENRSDDDLLIDLGRIVEQIERRGISERVAVQAATLRTAFAAPLPLTDLELPGGETIDDILGRIDQGDEHGQGTGSAEADGDEGRGSRLKAA